MKIHLRSRHFKESNFLGAVSGEPEAIKDHGDPLQRALLEAYPGASNILVSINWCKIDKAKYAMREYTDLQYQFDKREAALKPSNDIIYSINLIQTHG